MLSAAMTASRLLKISRDSVSNRSMNAEPGPSAAKGSLIPGLTDLGVAHVLYAKYAPSAAMDAPTIDLTTNGAEEEEEVERADI